jgi:L-lactate dehydrogenase complex protein LldG
MSASRDMILAAVRANAPRAAVPLPAIPLFDDDQSPALKRFRASFELLGGTFVDCPPGADPKRVIAELFPDARVICSNAPEVPGNRRLEDVRAPAELEDVDVAVVRPAFAVAETGSIYLSEVEFGINALGYLAQHLVALLDPADILGNLHHAYRTLLSRQLATRC